MNFSDNDQRNWEPQLDKGFRLIAAETISPSALERIKQQAMALESVPESQHNLATSITPMPTTNVQSPRRRHALVSLAVVAIFLLMLGGLFLGGPTQNHAYAQMVVRLDKMKSFVCHVSQVSQSKQGEHELAPKQKLTYMAPSLYRSTGGDGVIQISNASTRESILLDNDRKETTRLKLPDRTDGEMSPLAFVEGLRSHFLSDRKSIRELGVRVIEEQRTIGFQSEMNGLIVKAWLDPETNLPIEVRMRAPTPEGIADQEGVPEGITDADFPVTWVVYSGFQYDVELDKGLFAIEVPQGYREVRVMTASTKALLDRFDLFVAMLRKCAEHNDGVFPTSLEFSGAKGTCFEIVDRYSLDWAAKRDVAVDFEEKKKIVLAQVDAVKEFLATVTNGLDFHKLPPNALDFHFFPGARLNQQDRPVAWFSPDGKKTYRVLFADLTAKDMEAASLPQEPTE